MGDHGVSVYGIGGAGDCWLAFCIIFFSVRLVQAKVCSEIGVGFRRRVGGRRKLGKRVWWSPNPERTAGRPCFWSIRSPGFWGGATEPTRAYACGQNIWIAEFARLCSKRHPSTLRPDAITQNGRLSPPTKQDNTLPI